MNEILVKKSPRDILMTAAYWIRNHQKLYDFNSVLITDGCGTASCALGWIAAISGMTEAKDGIGFLDKAALIVGADSEGLFYRRMEVVMDINKGYFPLAEPLDVARGLHRYANQYYSKGE